MRKMLKKVMTIFTAGVMMMGAASLAACGGFTPDVAMPGEGTVQSNGGFVVKKGDYVYFINGVETYTSDNTYGTPVKGALMRVKESDVLKGENKPETVIPSLMVAADYSSGLYIYGDRIFYATPSNVKNTDGNVQNTYLDFKSAKLDGTDIQSYFNVSSNSTVYRFVSVKDSVYLIYISNNEIHSYNTANGTDTALATNVGEYVLDSTDKTNPVVYYTMKVTPDLDVEDSGSQDRNYTQVYRVSAETTEAPYTYEWDPDYLEAHEGEAPYTNLGTIVLDGIGSAFANEEDALLFTHDLKEGVVPSSSAGYTYTLQAYTNGGIYFTRSDLTTTSSVGEDGWLYYLSEKTATAEGWNSVSGNEKGKLEVVAQDTTNAGTASIFYLDEEGGHHYLYVSNSDLFRADVRADGNGTADVTRIGIGVGSATLLALDGDSTYKYVYYTVSGSAGDNLFRAVYNGEEEDYKLLNNKPAYKPAQVLTIEHAKSWYPAEFIGNLVYFADAEALGSTSYNYVSVVSLANASGNLMNNEELQAYDDKFDETVGDDGYLAELTNDGKTNLSTAIRYFFYTGEDEILYANIEEAERETGKPHTLYSEEEVKEFKDYVDSESHVLRSDYITRLGTMTEADEETADSYWKTTLQHYTYPEETETGLPGWAWALIGVGIGLVVVGAGLAVFFVLRKRKKKENAPKKERYYVDTTDDKDVDVYSDEPQPLGEEVPEETAEAEEPQEETAEPQDETAEPQDEAAEPQDEAAEPQDEAAEPEEAPAEEQVPEEAEPAPEEQPEVPGEAPETGETPEEAPAPEEGEKPIE